MNNKLFSILVVAALLTTLGVGCTVENQKANTNASIETNAANTNIHKANVNDANIINTNTNVPSQGEVLDLSNRGLTSVPMDIFNRVKLTELNLSHNNLTGALPAEVRRLQNLQVLNLSYNKFTGVPAEVGQLKKLLILDLSNNELTGLPYEIGNLTQLQVLNVSGNNYSEQDLAKITSTLPNTQIIK